MCIRDSSYTSVRESREVTSEDPETGEETISTEKMCIRDRAKARAGIEKLVHLTPQTARVLHNGKETVIPAQEVRVGDLLRVLPGESVPVDGVITFGQTSINQAVMTGESLPVDKSVGDEVSSGTLKMCIRDRSVSGGS